METGPERRAAVVYVNSSNLTLNNSTIADNQADYNGSNTRLGGGFAEFGNSTVVLNNTVLSGNTSGMSYAANSVSNDYTQVTIINEANYSYLDAAATFPGTGASLITTNNNTVNGGSDPMLGELLDNGGTVLSMSPLNGSPLIGTGGNGYLAADAADLDDDGDTSEDLPLDGRHATRILDTSVDIGAVEQFDDETIGGTAGDNSIIGGAGDDVLSGEAGNDTITGDTGQDQLFGGDDDDTLILNDGDALFGSEVFDGGSGTDLLLVQGGAGAIGHGLGSHTLTSLEGLQFGYIAAGGDRSIFLNASQFGSGLSLTATITGYDATGSNETLQVAMATVSALDLSGLVFADWGVQTELVRIVGDGDDETVAGTSQRDIITGGAGIDDLSGHDGDDVLIGGADGDVLDGGDGTDTVSYETAAAGIRAVLQNPTTNTGDAAGDSYVAVENLTGSDHADQLIGDANVNTIAGRDGKDRLVGRDGNDSLFGGGDNDRLEGGLGADVLNGGDGQDRAQYDLAVAGVRVDFNNTAVNTGEAIGDSFSSVENILGSKFDDTLRGDAGDNKLLGNARNDSLSGRGGNDLLIGGGGVDQLFGGAGTDRLDGGIRNDTMTGGGDADTFVFAANSNTDRILDFADNVDRLELNDNLWTNTLTAADVVANFAVQAGANVRFDFAGGERLIVENMTTGAIVDDIDIV